MTKANEKTILQDKGVTRVLYKSNYKKTPSQRFRKKITQNYDPEKIEVTQAGVTYNVYDRIQDYEPQTNFYKVIEEYNCRPDEAMERMKGKFTEIKGVIDQNQSYAEHLMNINKAKEQFDALPVKIKNEFNNSVEEFLENGDKFLNKYFKEEMTPKQDIIMGDETDEQTY